MADLTVRTKGTLLTALGVLVLTPDGLLVRLIDTDAWTLLIWRGFLFAIAITLFYLLTQPARFLGLFKKMGTAGIIASLCFTSSTLFFVQSLHNTSVANTLVLIATAPLFAALLGAVILKEKLPLSTWLAIAVSLIGITYIFSESLSSDNLIGDIFALGAAMSIAAQITTVRRAKNVDMVPSLILSGICIGVVGIVAGGSLETQAGSNLLYILLLGLVVLPISFGLITVGPRFIPAAEVSLLMLLETSLGPVWAWLVLSERPANETLAGGALVVTTLVVHTLYTARRERAAAS